MSPRLAAVLAGLGILLSSAGIIWVQTMRLDLAESELRSTRERLASTSRAMSELEINFEKTVQRKTASTLAQEAISSAPTTEDRPIGDMLLRGLSGADLIGGFE